jgi:hypothetical protein
MASVHANVENLMNVTEMDILIAAGVDNWQGYEDAMDNYEESLDQYEDAENFLNALYEAGVNNWEGFGEGFKGIDGYRAYLETIQDFELEEVLTFDEWKTANGVSDF